MRQHFRFLLAPLLCLAASSALSDTPSESADARTDDARTQQTRELQAVAESSFASLDRNKDGRLSRSEAGFDRLLAQTFAVIDTDGDGFVTAEEFAAAQTKSSHAARSDSESTLTAAGP